MSLIEDMKQKLAESLEIELIRASNESHKHAGHHGYDGRGETHVKLIVVSTSFDGCTRLQRHYIVNSILNQYFKQGLHALTLQLYTPAEYQSMK